MKFLARLFRRRQINSDLSAELRAHLAEKTDALVASGMPRREAELAARRQFGNSTELEERGREVWRWPTLESFLADFRFAFRMLRKNPGFTAVAILTLALGIGANTAIFSVVNAVIIRPLPYDNPRNLVWMFCQRTDRARAPFSIPDFEDYQSQSRALQSAAAFNTWGANLTGKGVPKRIQGIKVSGNFLELLGVKPALGRNLGPADESPQGEPAVVITHGLWQDEFGADPAILGKTILLNEKSYRVIGVLPEGFFFPQRDAEVATQLNLTSDPRRSDRGNRFLRAIGRLRQGVAPQQAESELSAIAQRLREKFPETNDKNIAVHAFLISEELLGNLKLALTILSGAVGMVLLLACANLSNLMLERFTRRRYELAVRRVLGATSTRIVRQLFAEGLLLTFLGGSLGYALAQLSIPFLQRHSPAAVRDLGSIAMDVRVFAFVVSASVFAVLLFGSAPAILASRGDAAPQMKNFGASLVSAASGRGLKKILVIAEAALALVLVSGAGLFAKSFQRLANVDPGFDSRGVLTMRVSLPPQRYSTVPQVIQFEQKLQPLLASLPGVKFAGVTSSVPLSGTWAADDFTISGRPPLKRSETPSAQYRVVSEDYFRAMSIPIRAGRPFSQDDRLGGRPVVIVNQTLADHFWPGSSPLGEHLKLTGYAPLGGDAEIVGVVGNVKHLALEEDPSFDVYVPVQQVSMGYFPFLANGMSWVVRSDVAPQTLATAARSAVQAADSEVPTSRVAPLGNYLSEAAALRRFNAWLASLFGAAGLFLATIGIYGVVASTAAQRRRELGLRLALGASRSSILRMVFAHGMALAMIGIAAGIACSLGLSRWISGLLFGIPANDLPTLFEAVVVSVAVSLFASCLPALRAMSVDPVIVLRHE